MKVNEEELLRSYVRAGGGEWEGIQSRLLETEVDVFFRSPDGQILSLPASQCETIAVRQKISDCKGSVMNKGGRPRKYWLGMSKEEFLSVAIDSSHYHNLTQRALQFGVISKAPCVKCGSLDVEAHHSDYSKPLDITWLCRPHHIEVETNKRWQKKEILPIPYFKVVQLLDKLTDLAAEVKLLLEEKQ